MNSGIHELQHRFSEQARGQVDHQSIARRSRQVALEQENGSGSAAGAVLSQVRFGLASVVVALAAITIGFSMLGGIASASELADTVIPNVSNGDNSDSVVEQAAPDADRGVVRSIPVVDNGDDSDDPMVKVIPIIGNGDDRDDPEMHDDPSVRPPGNPRPYQPKTREDLGLPLDDTAPGRMYLFVGHGDPNDAPVVE